MTRRISVARSASGDGVEPFALEPGEDEAVDGVAGPGRSRRALGKCRAIGGMNAQWSRPARPLLDPAPQHLDLLRRELCGLPLRRHPFGGSSAIRRAMQLAGGRVAGHERGPGRARRPAASACRAAAWPCAASRRGRGRRSSCPSQDRPDVAVELDQCAGRAGGAPLELRHPQPKARVVKRSKPMRKLVEALG